MASAAPSVPTPVEAWRDSNGAIHPTKEAALAVEVEKALSDGPGGSMTPGVARRVIEQREQLIPLLAAFGPVPREAVGEAA